MIKGLVFDMDGLIFDTERIVQRSWNDVGRELGIENMGNHIYNTIGFNRKRRAEYFRANISEDFPNDIFAERTRERFYEIKDAEGIALKNGAKELIVYAKEHGYKVALATSSRSGYAKELLENAGILQYFDGFVFGDMVKNSKPDPEVYLKACEMINLKPKECMALEDAPAGVQSASKAGLLTCMIPDLVKPDDAVRKLAHHVFESLEEVIALLKA